ncbi:MAG TPA: hypothetical protein VIV15_11565, partial [Anaerolineales bacterium]
MITSKFKWLRLTLSVLMGLLAFGPLVRLQPAKALTPPQVGMLCTTGAALTPTFHLTAESGYIMMPDMTTMFMWSYGLLGSGFQHPG